ncbi:penicillin acylase family protein [Alkalibacillus sp. S2W]|uniref:penicillin acylase family protein n=1 Tax=Alkalibacillus sp. S2W TaxID=3386553 RepID=UPI00398D3E10
MVDVGQKKRMHKGLKWSLIIIGILVVIMIIALLVVNAYINRSLPKTEGEVEVSQFIDESDSFSGLSEDVDITRDDDGVPHISAENDEDLFFAQGFVTAQDRLFQMEMSRRQASGKLSEVVGDMALNQDKYFRTLGLRRAAEKSISEYDDETMQALEAYAAGVNAYIEQADEENGMPIEFALMGLDEVREWTPLDSLTIGKFMAYDLGGHWERQAFNYHLIHNFPEEEAYELFPSYPEDALTNISDEEYVDVTASMTKAPSPPEFNGSNNWAVSGDKTESGQPLLADDPHLGLATPSIWYQVQLDSPNYQTSGVIFAGVPGVILGQNQDIAWGVTNVGPDVQQLYLEKRHEENPHQFLYDDEWYEADVINETIEVDGEEPIDYEVVETKHGPVISEFANPVEAEENQTVMSIDWTALEATKELSAVLQMNRASNWDEFETALEDFHAPAQNFVFASTDGTIAYKANGRIPIYDQPDQALLPMEGWNPDHDLTETIPYDELPTLVNPEKGFVGTANNKIISDEYLYHISHVWAQPYRYTRIHEFLEERDQLTKEDMKTLQMDTKNLRAREFVPMFTELLSDGDWSETESNALDTLAEWNFQDKRELAGPLVFDRLFANIEAVLFEEAFSEDLMGMFKGSGQTIDELIRHSYEGESVSWIEKNGGLQTVVREAFKQAVENIESDHGSDVSAWQWGDYHQVYFEHPLSSTAFLDVFFNEKEPKPVDGSPVTVMAASHNENGIVDHGASWRFVTDMVEPLQGDHIVGPGQAGHYRSEWYDDQITDWVEGQYHTTNMEDFAGETFQLLAE